jgi:hypothetical protein
MNRIPEQSYQQQNGDLMNSRYFMGAIITLNSDFKQYSFCFLILNETSLRLPYKLNQNYFLIYLKIYCLKICFKVHVLFFFKSYIFRFCLSTRKVCRSFMVHENYFVICQSERTKKNYIFNVCPCQIRNKKATPNFGFGYNNLIMLVWNWGIMFVGNWGNYVGLELRCNFNEYCQ